VLEALPFSRPEARPLVHHDALRRVCNALKVIQCNAEKVIHLPAVFLFFSEKRF
jgi:hypothetical protein